MTRLRAALLALSTMVALFPATAAQAEDEGPEQIVNGSFDAGTAPWWSTGNTTLTVQDGRACADIPGGTANPWDVIIGQNDLPWWRARRTPTGSSPPRPRPRSAGR
ncbi:carbohydrate binding domain-containing protein [Nonomuraea rubra]|uniref:carbohydrate binding domain-containing protein n=1 Tax=Nonomuraea rubra TaxID=46180 RepID=UPI00361FDB71